MQEDTLVAEVRAALAESGFRPSSLVLEITESMLLPGEGVTMERLRELADLGVRLFIDDFGTGYSSLSYLQQLPVHGIKLAREFVCTLGVRKCRRARAAATWSSTIRSIAETLGLHVDHRRGSRDARATPGPDRPRLHARAGVPDGPTHAGERRRRAAAGQRAASS